MLPTTSQRVPSHTCDRINQQIHSDMMQRVESLRGAPHEAIRQRLDELEHEWDTERILETNAASLALAGCVLAATVNRRWVYLPMAITGFLLQHALQGWCPPLPIIRRLGIRTMREIDEERVALKALRGDFEKVGPNYGTVSAQDVLHSVSR